MGFELDFKKRDVLEKVLGHLRKNRAGYIRVPTGWGKTFMALHLMNDYRRDGQNVVFVVFRNNALLRQTFKGEKSLLCPADIMLCGEVEKPTPREILLVLTPGRGSLVAATVDALIQEANSDLREVLLKHCHLLVVDEVHNFIANQGTEVIRQAFDSGAHIFGMTATPMQGVVGRLKFVWDILPEMEEIWSKNMAECILDDEISGGDYYILRSPSDASDVFGESSLKSLERMEDLVIDIRSGDREERIERLVRRSQLAHDIYTRLMNGEKALVFCAPIHASVQKGETERIQSFHSKMTAAVFNEEVRGRVEPDFDFENSRDGHYKMACYLSSDLTGKEQRKLIKSFKGADSNPRVLCTIGMLVEGFDFPDLKNMILLRPTLSPRLFTQQLGRVLRKSPHCDRAKIVEIVDDLQPMYDLLETAIAHGTTGAEGASALLSLSPVERLVNVVGEGGDFRVFKDKFVSLHDIVVGDGDRNWSIEARHLVPVQTRAEAVSSLLSLIREISRGKLKKQRSALFQILSGVSLVSIDDAERVRGIVSLLEDETRIIKSQPPIDVKVTNEKLKMFQALKWYVLCRALSSIESEISVLGHEEKTRCMDILVLPGTVTSPKDGMLFCLGQARGMTDIASPKKLKGIGMGAAKTARNLRKSRGLSRRERQTFFRRFNEKYSEELLWIDCFRNDPDVALLIENLKRDLRAAGLRTAK